MDEIIYIGTEAKLNISVEPMEGAVMDDYAFECEFYCLPNRRLVLDKSQLVRVDENNYIAVVDTKPLGVGMLKCKVTAYLPDADCGDGIRTEVILIDTGYRIANA